MELAVDTQIHLRLAVSRRIETALGAGHLRKDPLKKVKEDFLPPDTHEIIADVAQKKENLSWAQNRLAAPIRSPLEEKTIRGTQRDRGL
jgi:hypothetical protein